MIVYLFFQNFHWINILWSLFVVLVIVPTVYYLINERSFKALSYQKNSEFSGYLILFVLLSVVFVILMTVIISAFAPSLL